MPKPGFKSLTVHESTYDHFETSWRKQKDKLADKGIFSLTGYVTYCLADLLKEYEIFAKHGRLIRVLSIEKKRVILKDEMKDRIVEVHLEKKNLHCMFCNSSKCLHIGFCYSIHQIYEEVWG